MQGPFTLEFWRDGEWYVGRLVEVPGVFSQGASLEELQANIQDYYKLIVADTRTPINFNSHEIDSSPPQAIREESVIGTPEGREGWLAEQAERDWDEQIERDERSGRLDALINRALEEYKASLRREAR